MFALIAILVFGSFVTGEIRYSPGNKGAFYEDCEIFNRSHVYGGPVCGNDARTYANSVYLDCVNHQNFGNVATVHSGECLPSEEYCKENLLYKPVCGSDNSTYSNVEALLCTSFKEGGDLTVSFDGPCKVLNPCYRDAMDEYGANPVCANNGFTYQNAGQVKCLQQYNDDLKIVHDGGCTVRHVFSLYGREATVCQIARDRYEWNPLCATDGATYPNPFVYLCFASNARIASDGECGTSTQNACAYVQSQESLLSGEDVTRNKESEEQVCGSDGKTYSSQHHLQCRTKQDKYLYVRHFGPCSGPDDNPCGLIPEEEHRSPVCGSTGETYVSPEALWCSSLRSPATELSFLHDGQC